MKLKAVTAMSAALACWLPAAPAAAGAYTDDLSKCLVRSSTPADQSALIVWIFSAMSVHPDIKAYSNMTAVQREAATKRAAELMQRLLTVDCRSETVAALKNEGTSAFGTAFGVLGQAAMRGMMTNAEVDASMGSLQKYMDAAKFEALGKEAGLTAPSLK